MAVQLSPVRSRGDLRRFIYLAEVLHRDHPMWMPPLYADEWAYFDPRKNRAFSYSDTTLVVAERDGRPVGRIMGIVNRRHNEFAGQRTARFAQLETMPDPEVLRALLGHVEGWARSLGMNRVIGPFGFNDQEPEGFLIEGFEHHPTIVTYYNFPWLIPMLEAEGYGKEVDYVVYRVPAPKEIPPLMAAVAERLERRGFRPVRMRSKREARSYILPVLRLMNESYDGIYGYTPLDPDEMADLAEKYLAFLDLRFVTAVEKDGELVSFMVGLPDLWEGFVRSRGRLLPFGWYHLLRVMRRKRFRQLDLLLAGVKEGYRGKGLDMLMGREMTKALIAAGVEVIDSHHELETNTLVRAEMERQGGEVYKRYRVFQKPL